jgi:CRISPR-associated protein Cas1
VSPYRRVYIPKSSGGVRPLDIPSIVDRVAQGAVAMTLMPVLEREMEDSSFAYRPGRSVAQAVQRVASHRRDGFRWVVDGDIVRFFERVPHDRLIELLERHVDDSRLVDLIALWLENASHEGVGLPQGSPLSPLLANLYLDLVDEQIEGRGVRLVRFADDFVLLCKSADGARGALEKMSALLDEHGLELHQDKTRIVPFDQGFRFLGHVFVRSMVWREVIGDETPSEDVIAEAERAISAAQAADETAQQAGGAVDDEAKPPRGRWAVRQRVLYAVEPGRNLTAKGDSFFVMDGEAKVLELPFGQVDRIEVGPGVSLDVEALDLAAASDTRLCRVDGRGRTLGQWHGRDGGRTRLHLAQAAAVNDTARRVELAREIAKGRVFNQRALVRRLNRKLKDADMDKVAVMLGRCHRKFRRQDLTVQQIMGIEGEAASYYWPGLGICLGMEWRFGGKRARRNGNDPVNILLDCMAGMLTRDIEIAIERAGLHAGFSVLHEPDEHDEATLAFDLAEEFRGPVAEACVMTNIGRGALTPDLFAQDNMGWRIVRGGWPVIIRTYETWIGRSIVDPVTGDSVLWRTLFERQARRFAEACVSVGQYVPYKMDY